MAINVRARSPRLACRAAADRRRFVRSRNRSKGSVLVKRLDHVVAIAPGIRKDVVFVHAGRVGIARDIEPVPAPTLAILRRGEQPVDDLREGIRGVVRQKLVDLLQSGRQARQIECRAPQQRQLRGWRGRLESTFSSNFARMNRSMGLFTHFSFLTLGGA